ncbi:MAG: helix-turn-helix domain-containing protein [Erysipelotrichaceae bacterium]|nr:helix-turn-helix domain-containing protein [Erysipelotrichaceae bacterium]
MNYLPSKLLKLRKHYNYSQAHLAEVLGVDVVEYMAYENGRKVLNYAQCKKIANLYHVGVVDIFKNTDEVTLYEVSNAKTDELNIEYFIPKKTFDERIREFIKNNPVLVGMAAGVVILGIIVIALFGNNNDSIPYEASLTNINRLSVSETTVVYIYGDGAVKGSGDNSNGQLSNLPSSSAIKVAEGKDFTVILHNDGTLSAAGLTGSELETISKWRNIVDIAAGDDHVVAVDNKGEVYAVGHNNDYGQCDVNGFKNIRKVYATSNGTIVLDNEGKLSFTGEFVGSSQLKNFSNIIDIDASNDNLVILDGGGSIEYIAKYKNFLNIYKWKDIVDVTCGDAFVAALGKDGKVLIDCEDARMEKEVAKWENIIAIDSGNDYLIAFDGERIYGTGRNEYHQFVSDDFEQTVLDQVGDVKISIGEGTIDVSFAAVENAGGYEVRLNAGEGNVKKVASNQMVSFFADGLVNGNNYQITITTLGDDEKYLDSEPLVVDFTYIRPGGSSTSEEYIDIDVYFEGMGVEEFKKYLASIGVSNIICVETGSPCEGDTQTIISVDGISHGQRIARSDLANAMVTYYTCQIPGPEEGNE